MMNIIFLATSDFAIFPLIALSKTTHKITLITKPDKPKGRGLLVSKSQLVLEAEKEGIRVFQNDDIFPIILKEACDLIVCVGYGRILKPDILSLPRYKAINLHPSLLPLYRGAAPISWALINGEEKTGVSVFFMDKTMDGGDIILQKEVDIFPNDDYKSLSGRLSKIGGELLIDAISLIEKGKFERKKQLESKKTFAPKIKEPFFIDFNEENKKIFNLIRGVPNDPGVWMRFNNERIKVLKGELCSEEGEPSKIIKSKDDLIIGCKKGSIILKVVQKMGKKPISGLEFLCGIKNRF